MRLVVEAARLPAPGLTAEQLLEQIGLEPGCLRNPDGRMDVRDYATLAPGAALRRRILRHGPATPALGQLRLLSRSCMQQPTLEKALVHALEFLGLA